jgi:hypothetical protein
MRTGVWLGYLSERDNLEDLGTDGKIILQWIFKEIGRDGLYGVYLAQDGDMWLYLARTVRIKGRI